MAKIVLIPGELEFDFYKEGYIYFSNMLALYKPKDRVSEMHGKQLHALLQRHPNAREKIGSGVDHFEVRLKEHGAKCFHVVRPDGSVVDFSIKKAVRG